MTIALIWAQARDNQGRPVIGANGGIPWHVPEDFRHFKKLTNGHPVIMGLRTWESLPTKPLPGRTNIVLASSTSMKAEPSTNAQTHFCGSLDDAIYQAAIAPGGNNIWIIGGASVYAQAIPQAERIELTEIDLVIPGDTFAPIMPPEDWREVNVANAEWRTSKTGVPYRFRTFLRDYSFLRT